MKKYQIILPQTAEGFGSLVTKYPSDSIQVGVDELTGNSFNVDTTAKGVVTKRPGKVVYNPIPFTNPTKDQYEAIFSDGVHHLLEVDSGILRYTSGDRVFHDVTSGYSPGGNFEFTSYQDRVYFTNGIDPVQVYDRTVNYGGVTYTAPKTKNAGAQPPLTAVTFDPDTAGGNVPAGAHTYVVTFLYYDSEESDGGPVSSVHTVSNPNNTVNLTNVPIGGYGVTTRKIYRDNNDGLWLLVGEIFDNVTTTFTDTASIGTSELPADQGIPPEGAYIVEHLDRLWISGVSGDQNIIFFSSPGLPDIFPSENFILCNPKDPVTALVVYNDSVWVFNRNSVGKIAGRTTEEFRYIELPGSVGCVDNRSLQARTIDGVPTLVWLSDKGFYQTNGSSIVYISDKIEDLVNLNIQQSQQVKGRNSQSTQADFQAGTPSGGIDLTSEPGFITTPNPKRVWDDSGDWEGGSVTDNIVTQDGTNTIKVPTNFNPTLESGTLTNLIIDGGNLKLTTASNFTGISESNFNFNLFNFSTNSFPTGIAYPITISRAGTLNTIQFSFKTNPTLLSNIYNVRVWSDALGTPGTVLFTGPTISTSPNTLVNISINPSLSLSPGTYWFGATINNGFESATYPVTSLGIDPAKFLYGTWQNHSSTSTDGTGAHTLSFSFCPNAVSQTGQWVSPIHDTASLFIGTGINLTMTASYPSGSFCSGSYSTGSTTTLEGSNSSTFNLLEDPSPVTQSIANINGTSNYSISGKRYWRVTIVLNTTDDRDTPMAGPFNLKYNISATWVSEVIDATSDITAINALDIISTIPSGTSVTISIATSNDNITYPEGFVPFQTLVTSYDNNLYDTDVYDASFVVPRRYIKVKAELSATSDDVTTPSITSITLKWTIVANLISSIIDTGTVPAGWDIFQSIFSENGGNVSFEMRSASSSGGIPSATFFSVQNGQFPPTGVQPLQFAQWKVFLTSTADDVPLIDSVTLNWFITNTNSIRVASLFYDKNYYLCAAELGQTINNLLIVWTRDEKWRIYRNLHVTTFSLFFNQPYFSDAIDKQLFQFLNGLSDNNSAIEFNLETKALNFGKDEKVKVFRKIYVTGLNTGASYQFYYSIDEGQNWILMQDATSGSTTITTTTDATRFVKRLIAPYGTLAQGRTINIRAHNNDTNAVQLHQFVIEAWVREGEVINA